MRTVAVRMVSTSECRRCKAVEERILAAGKRVGVNPIIEKIDSSLPRAIDLGLEYELVDVPSFVIGKHRPGFSGESFQDSEIEVVIAREAK